LNALIELYFDALQQRLPADVFAKRADEVLTTEIVSIDDD
jgi:hypothetical protein